MISALGGTLTPFSIAEEFEKKKLKGLSFTNLKLFRLFYLTYPQIGQPLADQLKGTLGNLGNLWDVLQFISLYRQEGNSWLNKKSMLRELR